MYYESELYHHGIKGQKWGERNGPPYPLSDKDKKKISKKYYRLSKKANREVDKNLNSINQVATNQAFKELGPDPLPEDFNDRYEELMNQAISKIYSNNKFYKQAQELMEKYNMESWDKLASYNASMADILKKYQD